MNPGALELEEMASIVEHATIAIFLIRVGEDGSFTIETCNPAGEKVIGMRREQARGRPLREVAPNSAEQMTAHYRHCLELGGPFSYESTFVDADKRETEFHTTLIPIRNAAGVIDRILGQAQDLTEQKRTERELRASEEKFSKAFGASPLAIGVTDLVTARLLEVNEGFERTFEAKRAEVLGRTLLELGCWGDHPEERLRLIELVRKHGSVRNFPVHGRSVKGKPLRLLLSTEAITVAGTPCLVTFAHDVTELAMAETAKAELELQLREAQKLEALGTLAGGIAHDFNNILGAIVAYTDLMTMEIEKPAKLFGYLGELRKAGDRARDLVRQILTFSRRQKPERKAVRLQIAVREALQLLRSTLPAAIEMESFLDPAAPVVLADPSQIHQIVMNLCTNAAHAMRDRAGKLTVRLDAVMVTEAQTSGRADLRVGSHARLTVRDTGEGMDAVTLERVFEPFFTTKPLGEGTGLGLAVVHGIVRDHEGAIAVRSRVGEGTVFELHFPEQPAELATEAEVANSLQRGKGEHVLLVDDEHALRASVGGLLRRLGYNVTIRNGPVEALDLFRAGPDDFDLVLTDLSMPVMTGIEMAKEILALRPHTRIVVMSGFSGSWTAQGLQAIGILDLLPKPITAQALAKMIAAALQASAPQPVNAVSVRPR